MEQAAKDEGLSTVGIIWFSHDRIRGGGADCLSWCYKCTDAALFVCEMLRVNRQNLLEKWGQSLL